MHEYLSSLPMSIHAPVPELYVSSDSAAKLKVAAGSLCTGTDGSATGRRDGAH